MLWGAIFIAAVSADSRGSGGDPHEKDSDIALVAAAQRGDADAFARLHARYYRRIYHLAHLKTNNASDAEDIASETFIRALSGLRRFRFGSGMTSLYPWLHRIAVNLVIDMARERPPSGILSLDAPLIGGLRALLEERTPSTACASPQEIIERREVQQLVRGAIAALPPDQGDVLVYRFLGDLSTSEMAPLLHRTEPAIKSLLHRAVVALRAEISRRLETIERLEAGRDQTRPTTKEAMQNVGLPDRS